MAKNRTKKKDANTPTRGQAMGEHLAKVAAAKAAHLTRGARVIIAMLYQIADNQLKSGRASGNVYMRNGRVRKMVVPSLVQNGYTTPVRSLLSMLSSSWNALTEAERLTWINATTYTRSNRFGVSFGLKGKDLYVALNANLINIGQTPITECPLPADVPGITGLTVTADESTQAVTLAYTPSTTDAGVEHLIYATAPLAPGVNRPSNSAFRLIGMIASANSSPKVASTDYTDKFGAFPADAKIFIKLIPINNVTGQAGAAIVAQTISVV